MTPAVMMGKDKLILDRIAFGGVKNLEEVYAMQISNFICFLFAQRILKLSSHFAIIRILLSSEDFFFVGILIINIFLFIIFAVMQHYSPYAVLVNIFSVLLLISLLVNPQQIYSAIKSRPIDLALCIGLFVLALSVYIYNIDVVTPGIQGDELTIAKASEQILTSSQFLPFVPVNLGHPTPLLYLTGLSIKTFGRSIMVIRLPYIFFGALSIAAFYILLRLFFNKSISTVAAVLMLFSYPFIIVSRLAYEVTPEIFLQIVTVIFLYFAWKTKDLRYYAAIGMVLGMGLYTYLGFRTFAVIILLFTSNLVFNTTRLRSTQIKILLITIASCFIVLVPILSYSIIHAQDLMVRTTALSAFSQGYSQTEIVKELFANIGRLTHLFFQGDPSNSTNGDTNYLRNPSNVSMFDIGTFIFFVIGLVYLFKTNKKLFLIILVLSVSPLVNDIFVIEKIPEALNPYGIGHPNTLRIAGIIPIIYFTIAYGLNKLKLLLSKGETNFSFAVYIILAFVIIYNWHLYFQQPTGTRYSDYINRYNSIYVMNMVNLINRSNITEVAVSPTIYSDERFTYFLKNSVKAKQYNPRNYVDAIKQAKENQMAIFDPSINSQLAIQILSDGQSAGLQIDHLSQSAVDPDHTIYAVILVNTQ
jgi:4-amino-4-deoxy-L-arabinose transferase-like glycosyltransferase